MFPSRSRKYVHLGAEQAYESIIHLMRENLGAKNMETEHAKPFSAKADIGGPLGLTVYVQVLPEGSVSALDFSFSYRKTLFISLVLLVAVIGLSLGWRTAVTMLVLILILPLGVGVDSAARRFLNVINEALPHLEGEFARRTLMDDRKRWQLEPKDTEDLHRRLREKHVKTWGNTNVLEYKIAEYEGQGLTRDEAIRKTAEEEGIH